MMQQHLHNFQSFKNLGGGRADLRKSWYTKSMGQANGRQG